MVIQHLRSQELLMPSVHAVVSCFAIEPSLVSTQVYRDVVTALDASVPELHLLLAWTWWRELSKE